MKKSVLIFLIAFSMWGGVVFAHETTTNGSASVFIHIDPDDNPKPGEPATLFIDVRNKEKGFSIENCDCVLTIGQEGTVLSTTSLVPSGDSSTYDVMSVPFTFPKNGTYDIGVDGTPKTPGTFTPFSTDYDVTIGAPTGVSKHDHGEHSSLFHIIHYGLFGGAMILALAIGIRENRKEKMKKKLVE